MRTIGMSIVDPSVPWPSVPPKRKEKSFSIPARCGSYAPPAGEYAGATGYTTGTTSSPREPQKTTRSGATRAEAPARTYAVGERANRLVAESQTDGPRAALLAVARVAIACVAIVGRCTVAWRKADDRRRRRPRSERSSGAVLARAGPRRWLQKRTGGWVRRLREQATRNAPRSRAASTPWERPPPEAE